MHPEATHPRHTPRHPLLWGVALCVAVLAGCATSAPQPQAAEAIEVAPPAATAEANRTPAPTPPAFYIGGGTGEFISTYFDETLGTNVTITKPNVADGGKVGHKTLGWFGELGPEWVAPNWMYAHPTLAPVFQHLEDIRMSGNVAMPAYAEGGATGKTPATVSATQSDGAMSAAVLSMLATSINSLTTQLQAGTLARVSTDQLEDTNSRLTTIRTEAQLNA